MSKFLLATDSGCDLSADYCAQREIYPLLMHYELDGVICTDTMQPADLQVFYDRMAQGAEVHTSAANIGDYLDFWKPLLAKKLPILHIAMGSGISSSYQNALLAREQLLAEQPQAQLEILDSLGASMVYGMQVIEAADFRDSDGTLEDCFQLLMERRHHMNPYYTTGNLEYLYKGGRVSRAGMVIAKALNIWPILNLNDLGELKVVDKCRGRQKTYDRIQRYCEELAVDPSEHTLYICHAGAPEEGIRFGEQLQRGAGFRDIFYSNIGTTIGAHTGPGLVCAYFYGKPRTPSK